MVEMFDVAFFHLFRFQMNRDGPLESDAFHPGGLCETGVQGCFPWLPHTDQLVLPNPNEIPSPTPGVTRRGAELGGSRGDQMGLNTTPSCDSWFVTFGVQAMLWGQGPVSPVGRCPRFQSLSVAVQPKELENQGTIH